MKPPRRIFRSSSIRTGRVGRALAWVLGGTLVVALGVMVQSSDLLGRVTAGPEHLRAGPNQVAVVGGDTLRLDGRVVRLAGIEAPGLGDTCRKGVDCGGEATRELAGLVRDHGVECRLEGQDRMGRPFGACAVNGLDLSSAVVASGWARAQRNEPVLADLELSARRRGAGLWAAAGR